MSAKGWIDIQLESAIEFRNGKSSPERSEKGENPVYGGNGIIGYTSEFNSDSETVIVGRVGAYCGSLYFHKGKCWVTDNAIIGKIKNHCDGQFLFYLLKKLDLNNYRSGSSQPLINQSTLNSIEVRMPSDKNTQQRIANILSSLDEKIELNRQTNATLEAIAQAIFKEWFIEFRFPGSTGEMQESELGTIPKGWRMGSIEDILKLSNETVTPGTDPNTKFFHFSIPAFDNGRTPVVEQAASILSNKFKVRNNSILVSKLNPRIPRIWAVGEVDEERSICSTEFQVLLPIKKYFHTFALNLFSQSSIIEEMKGRASGTSGSHQRIRPQDILDIKTIIPDDEIMIQFDKVTGIYSRYITANLTEAVSLSKIRDNLLPKLMSGEIEV